MPHYNIEDIREAYIQKKEWEKQFPIDYFIVRPISFYLTYCVLLLTENPARVAFFGFLIGVTGCLLFIGSSIWSLWPGILFLVLYSFSDATDGNVARTTGNVTLFGVYLDGLLGALTEGSYLFFVGLGLSLGGKNYSQPGLLMNSRHLIVILPLLLGSLILISNLWSIIFRNLYETYKIKKEGLPPLMDSKVTRVIGKSTYHDRWYYLLFINLDSTSNQLLLLIFSVIFEIELLFLIFFWIFYSSKALIFFFFYFRKTKTDLSF